ncbi:MAG: carbohydrate ABC transporter permease [Elusimicrobia bacterium]|nr:carbohydrate ABC transporter permease [Elusimicrobiota bacterium]
MREEACWRVIRVAGVVMMASFCLFPWLYMLLVSLNDRPDFLGTQGSIGLSGGHYLAVLTERSLHFLDYLRNSAIVALSSAALGTVIAALAAFAVTRLDLPGKAAVLFFVLAASMFPQISLTGYLFRLMTRLGWINTYQGLLFPYVAWTLPLSLWLLVSCFSQIPKELDKAALVDGCTSWQVLWRVLLPVARPGIFAAFLLSFIAAFNEFLFALMLTTDHGARTVPVGIALFQGLHGEMPWGDIMAASIVATAPIAAIVALFQRHIVAGLTGGAVKG